MGNDKLKGWTLYCNGVNFGEKFFKMAGVLEDFSKPNPNAPKDIEGGYTLTVNGRTVTLSDGKDKVEATCYYEDNFDIGEGVRQCFEKLKKAREEIKVGDMVEITGDEIYDIYKSWIYKYLAFEDVIKYDYGNVPKTGTKGRVICIAPHETCGRNLACIETDYNKIYLVGIESLRKVVD